MSEPEPGRLRNVREASQFLGVHPKTVYGWVESHQIPHIRIGTRSIRFRQDDLDAFVSQFAVHARIGAATP